MKQPPPKPHDGKCQCEQCRAWAALAFYGKPEPARLVDPAAESSIGRRPHLEVQPGLPAIGNVCACTDCRAWAARLIALPRPARTNTFPPAAWPNRPHPLGDGAGGACLCDLCYEWLHGRRHPAQPTADVLPKVAR
jgi:hypothetical protein